MIAQSLDQLKRMLSAGKCPEDILNAVNAYLLAKAYARLKREQVDNIRRAVMRESPLYDTDGNLITDPAHSWNTSDEAFKAFAAECSRRERQAGVKPDAMADEYCPALVAETLLIDAQRVLVDATGPMAGVDWDMLCRYVDGKLGTNTWCDLWAGMVVNMPGYRKPEITKESVAS